MTCHPKDREKELTFTGWPEIQISDSGYGLYIGKLDWFIGTFALVSPKAQAFCICFNQSSPHIVSTQQGLLTEWVVGKRMEQKNWKETLPL